MAQNAFRKGGQTFSRGIPYQAKPSAVYLDASNLNRPLVATTPKNLTTDQQRILDRAIRVDHAGEVAANWIYKGQHFVLGRDAVTGPLIQDMWDQEKKHLQVMERLQIQHKVRPTILLEVAKYAGFGLGFLTAAMGSEAAMACTEAVETVIGEHYDDQLRQMDCLPADHTSIPLLKEVIKEFRDDELEHLNIAVDNRSQHAPAHALLSSVVGTGCKVAIELCKHI